MFASLATVAEKEAGPPTGQLARVRCTPALLRACAARLRSCARALHAGALARAPARLRLRACACAHPPTCTASQLANLSTLARVQLERDGALSGTQTARAEACSTLGSSLPPRACIRASACLRPLDAQSARTADTQSA